MVFLAIALLATAGCSKPKSDPTPPTVDTETAAKLQLSEDAKDPTLRDNEAGYNRWRPKPEPDGTASPLSPTRRKIDRRPRKAPVGPSFGCAGNRDRLSQPPLREPR